MSQYVMYGQPTTTTEGPPEWQGPIQTEGPGGDGQGGSIPWLTWLRKLIPGLGAAASGFAKGQAGERRNVNDYGLSRNRALADLYGTQQGSALTALLAQGRDKMDAYGTRQGAQSHALDASSAEGMNRSRLGMESGSVRAHQSVLGSLMKNLQPTKLTSPAGQRGHETTITGGLSASALDPLTRQHGDALMQAALQAQLTGSDVPAATNFQGGVLDAPPPTDYTSALIKPPELDPYQGPGKLETGTSWAGIIAAIQAMQQQSAQSGRDTEGKP